jgi:hypothetical protein
MEQMKDLISTEFKNQCGFVYYTTKENCVKLFLLCIWFFGIILS